MMSVLFVLFCRSDRRGMESLVEASAAEAEAISAALAAAEAKSRKQNGEIDKQGPGAEATQNGKPPSSPTSALIALNRASNTNGSISHTPPTGVRLHHRAVSSICLNPEILEFWNSR